MDKRLVERIALEEKSKLAMFGMDKACVDLVTRCIARINAERGKSAVAWAATSEEGKVEALGFNQSRRLDTPLFLSPTLPAGMVPVPINPTVKMKVAWKMKDPNWDVSYRAMLAAAQGERNAD